MNLNHLHLHVRDLRRAERFYESNFGLRKSARHGGIVFLRDNKGFELALAPDPKAASLPSWFHFGFRLGSAGAVRKLHSRLNAAGARVNDIEDYGDYVTFRCFDPDGYKIEVYWG